MTKVSKRDSLQSFAVAQLTMVILGYNAMMRRDSDSGIMGGLDLTIYLRIAHSGLVSQVV
jgi:hypothetical protein